MQRELAGEEFIVSFRVLIKRDGLRLVDVASFADDLKPAVEGGLQDLLQGRAHFHILVEELLNLALIGLLEVLPDPLAQVDVVDGLPES